MIGIKRKLIVTIKYFNFAVEARGCTGVGGERDYEGVCDGGGGGIFGLKSWGTKNLSIFHFTKFFFNQRK